jgi:hypothetical protein
MQYLLRLVSICLFHVNLADGTQNSIRISPLGRETGSSAKIVVGA